MSATNEGQTQQVGVGYRFELRHDVDRFPDFIAKKGATGTVVHIQSDGPIGAKMDQSIKGAEEWDNELWWHDGVAEFLGDAVPLGKTTPFESDRR